MDTITLGKMDNLYWLGRYIERVYQSIDLYSKSFDRMLDGDDFYKTECEIMGIPDTFKDARDFVNVMAFDESNPLSIAANLTRVFDNAMIMRDEISSDTLAYVHLAQADLRKAEHSDAPLMELQELEDHILAFWGSLDDNIDKESIRNIVKTGKRIERLDIFARIHADREDIQREFARLSKIDSTGLPYCKEALEEAEAIAAADAIDYNALLYKIWEIVPPLQ